MFGRKTPDVITPSADTERIVPMRGDLKDFARESGDALETTLVTDHPDTSAINPTDLSVSFDKVDPLPQTPEVDPLPQTPEKKSHRNRNIGYVGGTAVGGALAGLIGYVVTGVLGPNTSNANEIPQPHPTHPVATAPRTPGESTPPTTPETGGNHLTDEEKAAKLGQVGDIPTNSKFEINFNGAPFVEAKKPVTSKEATPETAALAAIQLSADFHIVFIGGGTDGANGYYQRETDASVANREEILDNILDPRATVDKDGIQAQVIAVANERDFLKDPNNRIDPNKKPSFTEAYKVVNVIDNGDGTFSVEMGRTVICNYTSLDGTFHKIVPDSTYNEKNVISYDADTKQWKAIVLNPAGAEQTINNS